MPPKTKFNKDQIIEAAFEIAKEDGFSALTARSVAKHLGSSVAPIYVNFEKIEDLIDAVVQRVFDVSKELMVKQSGPNVFENIGKASLQFAREYPVLFKELTMQANQYMASYETVEKIILKTMAEDEAMGDWTIEEHRSLLFKMRAFQTGLSVMVANGHIPSWLDDAGIEALLMEVGDELLLVQKIKKGGKIQ